MGKEPGSNNVVINPDFEGSIRDALNQVGDFKGKIRETSQFKILGKMVERIDELSQLEPGKRNQADEILDLPIRELSKVYDDNAGGIMRANAVRDEIVKVKDAQGKTDFVTTRLRKLDTEGTPGPFSNSSVMGVKTGMDHRFTVEVLAHELAHALTVAEMRVRFADMQAKAGLKAPRTVRGFDKLKDKSSMKRFEFHDPKATRRFFNKIKLDKNDPMYVLNEAYASSKERGDAGDYGFTTMFEFISEAMTNPDFQRKLNGFDVKGGKLKSGGLLEKVFEAVGKLLGLKSKDEITALTEVITATDVLAENFVRQGAVTDGPKGAPITGFDVDPKVDGGTGGGKGPDDGGAGGGKGPDDGDGTDGGQGPDDGGGKSKEEIEKEKRQEAIEKAQERQEKQSKEVIDTALDPILGIAHGIGRVSGKLTQRVRNVTNRLTRAATTDNLKLINMFTMMGEAGKMLNKEMVAGAELEAKISNVMQPYVQKAKDLFSAHKEELVKKRDITLNVATKFDKKQTGTDGNPTTLKLNGNQRIDLYMKIMDGVTKDGAFDPKRFKHASSKDLYKKSGGFQVDGKNYVLTKEQVAAIQQDPRILVDAKELEIAEAIWDGYRAAVPEANKIAQRIAGVDVMDANNYYYSPKHLIGGKKREGIDALTAITNRLISGKDVANVSSNMEARAQTGGFPHELVNPMSSLSSYQYTVSTSMGNAEFAIRFDHFMNDKAVVKKIEEVYGMNWRESMDSMKAYIAGDKTEVGRADAIVSQLLSLRAQSILGYNPSVALKQIGSVMSAIATGKLPGESYVGMAKRALSLFRNTDEKKALVAEIMEHSEFFRQRIETGRINIDLNDIAENFGDFSSVADIPRSVLQKSGLGKFVMDKGGKINEARLKHVGDTMSWIRRFDEATLAAIWEAKKKDMFGDVTDLSPRQWKKLNNEFIEIAMESQPTYNYGSRTLNQRKQGMVAKALTQFSSQTTDNFGLAHRGIMEYLNSPRNLEDRARAWQRVAPLIAQNAYIAAVSVGYRYMTSGVRETLGADENRRTRMEKKFPEWYKHYFVEYVNGIFGQIPGTGAMAKQMSSAAFSAPVYGMSVPLLEEFSQTWSAISDRKCPSGRVLSSAPL